MDADVEAASDFSIMISRHVWLCDVGFAHLTKVTLCQAGLVLSAAAMEVLKK